MNIEYQLTQQKPNYILTFYNDGKAVGSFDFNEGRMHFEGDVSESGKVFVDWVIKKFQQRIDDAVKAEREACARVCDAYEDWCGLWGQDDNLYAAKESATEIAKAIRARGNT